MTISPDAESTSGQQYEQSLTKATRHRHGRYYTPSVVCDLMLALADLPEKQHILEPSCGAGAFLQRASHWLRQCPEPPQTYYLTGIDLDPMACQLAEQTLSDQFPMETRHIQIITGDYLATDSATYQQTANNKDGLFDLIIGNPPYIRQENLSGTMDKQAAVERLTAKFSDYLAALPEQAKLFSQQADVYLWFFLQSATLLKPGGTLAFITSNSWLNTSFGKPFQSFLTDFFHIRYLVESACERWFDDAAINSLIVVLEKKQSGSEPFQPVELIRFKQPLSTWLPSSDAANYWILLQQQIQVLSTDPAVLYKNISSFSSQHWSMALRASPELLDLLEHSRLWLRLEQLGTVRYPLKTGINRFFYMNKDQALGIEREFLFPVIRSAKQLTGWLASPEHCREFLFACSLEKEALAAQGKTGALAYIEWGESQQAPPRQKRSEPVPWPNVPSVQGRHLWYSQKPLPSPHILCNRFVDRRFFFALCEGELMEDQTFYGLTLSNPEEHSPSLIAGLLNCTLSCLLLELNARSSLGEGVLQYARCDMASFPILNPALYSPSEQQGIAQAFLAMAQRSILPLAEELAAADRLALDEAVLLPLEAHWKQAGNNASLMQLRNQWAAQLLERVEERRQMAQSVRRKKRTVKQAQADTPAG